MSMIGFTENWPHEVRMHYLRHSTAGTLICYKMPRDTPRQRCERMRRHLHFYQRLLRHIVKMHPGVFTDP